MSTSAANATKSLKIIKVLKDRLNSLEQKRYISQDKLSTAMKLTDQAMKTAIEAEKVFISLFSIPYLPHLVGFPF